MTAGGAPEQRASSWWARIRALLQPRHPQPPVSRDVPRAAVDLLAPPSWDEREAWQCLRPRTLAECIGQRAIVESLGIVIHASKERGEPLDHVLFYGPPGLGKTSFARVIANELGVQLRETSGPAMSRVDALVGILTDMEEGDVLCIEAAHQLPAGVTDALCQVLSDFAVDIVFDKGVHVSSSVSVGPLQWGHGLGAVDT